MFFPIRLVGPDERPPPRSRRANGKAGEPVAAASSFCEGSNPLSEGEAIDPRQVCGPNEARHRAGRVSRNCSANRMMASLLQARRITPLLGFLLVAVVFAIDTLTTVGGAIAVLYVLALLLVAPSLGIRRLVGVAVLCVVLTLTSFVIAHSDEWPGDAIMRCAIALLAIMAATLLLIRGKKDSQALAKQAALLDLSHEAIFVRGPDDRIAYWSDGAADLYGWPAEEAVGRDADELLATEFAEPRSRLVGEVGANGRWEGELVRRRRDGAKVVVLARWSISRAEGEAAALLETNTDITELRLAHDALRRREAELRTAQRLSQTGSVSCDIASGEFS